MSKDTNFSGHPVLSQIIKLINRDKVHKLATTTKVNRYVTSFDAFTHLVVMIYAALSGAKSIRQVVFVLFIGQQVLQGSSEGVIHP